MEAFTSHKGLVVTLDNANVDTDQIIAKQFLKSIKRTGFGEHLFHDWRYQEDGTPNSDFPLNLERFKNASILVARNNFGCGSSREHAVWAVQQYGFKVVVAPSKGNGDARIPAFADIFRNNSVKNGLLTVELAENEVDKIFEIVSQNEGLEATVDLETQRIQFHDKDQTMFAFDVDQAVKKRLFHGLDDIGITLQEEASIKAFEDNHYAQLS